MKLRMSLLAATFIVGCSHFGTKSGETTVEEATAPVVAEAEAVKVEAHEMAEKVEVEAEEAMADEAEAVVEAVEEEVENVTEVAAAAAPLACSQASYYADSLAGNATASGEPYDPTKLTAAHRELDFGTKLRVVREGHGEVMVTVNDRGPFHDARIIDLSRAAAEKIDLITAGVADVCIFKVE